MILVRLCFNGPPHRNPDGQEVPTPHLHLYRKGFGDKWAIPAPISQFRNVDDLWSTLEAFMDYCNIVEGPNIRKGLFT